MLWLLYLFILLYLLAIIIPWISLAPWVPTKNSDLKRIKQLANLRNKEIFYDLGCGNGRVIFYLSKKNPQAKFIGIELSFTFFAFCLLKKSILNRKNCCFKLKNAYNENLGNADVVYVFAASREKLKHKLKNKLEKELKPDAKIISYVFPMEGWKPTVINKPNKKDISIYLYEKQNLHDN